MTLRQAFKYVFANVDRSHVSPGFLKQNVFRVLKSYEEEKGVFPGLLTFREIQRLRGICLLLALAVFVVLWLYFVGTEPSDSALQLKILILWLVVTTAIFIIMRLFTSMIIGYLGNLRRGALDNIFTPLLAGLLVIILTSNTVVGIASFLVLHLLYAVVVVVTYLRQQVIRKEQEVLLQTLMSIQFKYPRLAPALTAYVLWHTR